MSPPAGTSVTVNVCEYTNVSQVSPYDTSASVGGNTLGVDGARSPDILTASPNEILIGVIIDGSVSAGTGMTMRSNFNGDVIEDVVAPVPGTYRITAHTGQSVERDNRRVSRALRSRGREAETHRSKWVVRVADMATGHRERRHETLRDLRRPPTETRR